MKPFSKTIQAITKYDEEMRKAAETFESEKAKALDFYAHPEEHIKAAQDNYTKARAEARQKFDEVLQLDFNTQKKAINEITTETAPADFIVTIEALRANENSIDDYEAAAYIEKYKDNFMALRTIVEMLQGVGKLKGVYLRYPGSILKEMPEVEKMLNKWANDYQPGSYFTALLLSDNNPLTALSDNAEVFLQKNFFIEGEEAAMAAALAN